MFGQHRTGDGGADAKTAIGGFLDRGHFRYFLDVDDQARPHAACAHLHQKISAACHDARSTPARRKGTNRFIKRVRAYISDIRHGRSPSPLTARPIWLMACFLGCERGQTTRATSIGTASDYGMLLCEKRVYAGKRLTM